MYEDEINYITRKLLGILISRKRERERNAINCQQNIIILITILYHFSASTFRSNSRKAVAADTTSEYSFGDNSAALTRCSHASKCRDIVVRNSAGN